MRKRFVLVVLVAVVVSLPCLAMAETAKAKYGYCWVTSDNAPMRIDDDQGHVKIIGSFPRGVCLPVSSYSTGAKVWIGGVYLRPCEVTFDPRGTAEWRRAWLSCQGHSLWKWVETLAGTKDFPQVTEAIICDMVKAKVVPGVKSRKDLGPPRDIAKTFSHEELCRITMLYTDLHPDWR